MTTFSDLRAKEYIEGNTFRRLAYSLAHAYLRGSSVQNDWRVLEIAADAPGYIHTLLKEEEGRVGHFDFQASERLTPVNTNRMVASVYMKPAEAEDLRSRLGIDLSDDKRPHLNPTTTTLKISAHKIEKAWLFRVYDPARPLIHSGTHSFSHLAQDTEHAKEFSKDIAASETSTQALDILQRVLGNEKAAFIYTSKNLENINFLLPEHIAKKLSVELKAANISFMDGQDPLSSIDVVGAHHGKTSALEGQTPD